MSFDSKVMDELNWRILELLQEDARTPYSEIGRRVGLSAPAVAERVRRMEDAGVITAYRAVVDPGKLGYGLEFFARLRVSGDKHAAVRKLVSQLPEVLECWHVTGEDCYFIRLRLESVGHLEELLRRLSMYGNTTTSLVLSKTVDHRVVRAPGSEPTPA
ncbi:Lrp/AsnC family transcriptional regulator [Calidithermus chliarophilus]|uniref:Lrp/AsnC family transcriptional regulator n=1 Tax=Calidithermus chliarophilus TaxID=52023 RepID=UPI00040F5FDD|nr:Lrp/AsnC family transcriptional regulator [Calidithermus chliarophilus]